jgi:hypothetical protein
MIRPIAIAILVLVGCAVSPRADVVAAERAASVSHVSELSAQQRRVRPRVRITRPPAAWIYPRPGRYSYPGPNAVRQCVDWYAVENRPSGTVITPQMRCRWVPG